MVRKLHEKLVSPVSDEEREREGDKEQRAIPEKEYYFLRFPHILYATILAGIHEVFYPLSLFLVFKNSMV